MALPRVATPASCTTHMGMQRLGRTLAHICFAAIYTFALLGRPYRGEAEHAGLLAQGLAGCCWA